jgi:hypothetical protein
MGVWFRGIYNKSCHIKFLMSLVTLTLIGSFEQGAHLLHKVLLRDIFPAFKTSLIFLFTAVVLFINSSYQE